MDKKDKEWKGIEKNREIKRGKINKKNIKREGRWRKFRDREEVIPGEEEK